MLPSQKPHRGEDLVQSLALTKDRSPDSHPLCPHQQGEEVKVLHREPPCTFFPEGRRVTLQKKSDVTTPIHAAGNGRLSSRSGEGLPAPGVLCLASTPGKSLASSCVPGAEQGAVGGGRWPGPCTLPGLAGQGPPPLQGSWPSKSEATPAEEGHLVQRDPRRLACLWLALEQTFQGDPRRLYETCCPPSCHHPCHQSKRTQRGDHSSPRALLLLHLVPPQSCFLQVKPGVHGAPPQRETSATPVCLLWLPGQRGVSECPGGGLGASFLRAC